YPPALPDPPALPGLLGPPRPASGAGLRPSSDNTPKKSRKQPRRSLLSSALFFAPAVLAGPAVFPLSLNKVRVLVVAWPRSARAARSEERRVGKGCRSRWGGVR